METPQEKRPSTSEVDPSAEQSKMPSASPSSSAQPIQTPVCLVLGMAGSGKTTLVDALSAYIHNTPDLSEVLSGLTLTSSTESTTPQQPIHEDQPTDRTTTSQETDAKTQCALLNGDGAFVLNIDPAVHEVPYEPNIDIRDTVDYKAIMRDYSLGPNGAILTSLNLYATRFDQVLSILENRTPSMRATLVDTPGQIETFTWSASGAIITDALALSFPTIILFVVDAHRARNALTFVSNMLYACSIMYKTSLPMILIFNKADVADCQYANAWLRDFDAFDAALKDENFVGNLARSMAMALEEFYNLIPAVSVSALTGDGMPQLVAAIRDATVQYNREYRPVLEERKRRRTQQQHRKQQDDIERFQRDAADDISKDPNFRALYSNSSDDDEGEGERKDTDGRDGSAAANSRADKRLAQLRGDASEEDEEERQAYEELKRYLEAIKGKK